MRQIIKVGLRNTRCGWNCTTPYFTVIVVKLLCSQPQFTCIVEKSKTKEFGVYENGSWKGILGLVANGTYDITLPEFTNTYQRFNAVDFTMPVFYVPMLLVTRMPTYTRLSLDGFMGLQWAVWLCITVAVLMISLTVSTTNNRYSVARYCCNFCNHYMNIFALLTNQFPGVQIVYISTKFLISFWALCSVIVCGLYSGQLLSTLIKFQTLLPFNDFESFTVCVEKGICQLATDTPSTSYIQDILHSNTIDNIRLTEAFKNNPILIELKEEILIQKILETNHKYVTWLVAENQFVKTIRGKCSSYILSVKLISQKF